MYRVSTVTSAYFTTADEFSDREGHLHRKSTAWFNCTVTRLMEGMAACVYVGQLGHRSHLLSFGCLECAAYQMNETERELVRWAEIWKVTPTAVPGISF